MHSNSNSEEMNKMTAILANWLKPFDFEEAANGSPVHLVFAEKVFRDGTPFRTSPNGNHP